VRSGGFFTIETALPCVPLEMTPAAICLLVDINVTVKHTSCAAP